MLAYRLCWALLGPHRSCSSAIACTRGMGTAAMSNIIWPTAACSYGFVFKSANEGDPIKVAPIKCSTNASLSGAEYLKGMKEFRCYASLESAW